MRAFVYVRALASVRAFVYVHLRALVHLCACARLHTVFAYTFKSYGYTYSLAFRLFAEDCTQSNVQKTEHRLTNVCRRLHIVLCAEDYAQSNF